MDNQTKKLIANVLILLGIAAVGIILWEYGEYLLKLKEYTARQSRPHASWAGISLEMPSFRPSWHWSKEEIFQIIAGVISIGTGISLKNQIKTINIEKEGEV